MIAIFILYYEYCKKYLNIYLKTNALSIIEFFNVPFIKHLKLLPLCALRGLELLNIYQIAK